MTQAQQSVRAGALMRQGPANWYPLVCTLDDGAKVVVKEKKAGWVCIEATGNRVGWISSNALISSTGSRGEGGGYGKDREFTGVPKKGVDRAAVGAMIKGLNVRLGIKTEVASAYEPLPGINERSINQFRQGLISEEVDAPVTAMVTGKSLLPRYLSLSPVLAAQQIAAWGGHKERLGLYCNQILFWMADRAGAYNVTPHAYATERGNNALCFPGGWIVIGGELISVIQDESELAGVIGHELAHAVFQHGEQAMSKESWRLREAEVFAELDEETGFEYDEDIAELEQWSASVIQTVRRQHSLDIELTADSASTVWLARAGYDPEGLMRFLKRLRQQFGDSLTGHGNLSIAWLNSRNELDTRITRLEKQIKKIKRKLKRKNISGKRFERRFQQNKRG
ncbi:MAG: M48 family metalloprotease [Candidatus Hatepunaea meridiana]|nr:M48 family metalloprotease [Candidatus Hatepunaea meridiana]